MAMDRRDFIKSGSIAASLLLISGEESIASTQDSPSYPLLRIGVMADIQYADRDPVPEHNSYYRPSLGKLREAVDYLNTQKLDFVVQLGDFVDTGIKSFDKVFPIWNQLRADKKHVIGNHDYEAAPRSILKEKFGLDNLYYDFALKGWRFIVLDTCEFGYLACRHNPEENQKVQQFCDHLNALGALNAKPWQGTMTQKQIDWLDERLSFADKNNEKAIVFGHYPVLSDEPGLNIWNSEKVIKNLCSHNSFNAYICGHHHAGSFAKINSDYYWTVNAMMSTPDTNSYGVMEIYEDKLVVNGFGRMEDRVLALKNTSAVSCDKA